MSERDQSTALVRPDQWGPGVRTVMGDAITSLAVDTPDGKRDLIRAYQEDCKGITDYINTVIDIRDILIHPAESLDEVSGNVHRWARIVLILRDGTLISCGSEGVMKSLRLGTIINGPLPWASGKAKVKQQELGNGRRWYVLEWCIGDNDTTERKAVKK